MKKIRSFIYLDNYKMYSISSQIFEGLTEYILKSENTNTKEKEEQKGPVFSGRVLADIIEKDTNYTEKKFLHDFSYNLFEEALQKDNRVLEINKSNISTELDKIPDYSFIKITSNVVFNDLETMEKTISSFNRMGEALGFITLKAKYDELMKGAKEDLKNIKDRNQKSNAIHTLKNKASFKKVLIDEGLNLDDDYLKNMEYLIQYGYHRQFEVQMPLSNSDKVSLFSAQLNRDNLKESENNIVKKYSRESEKEFTLFGIVTQKMTKEKKEEMFESLKINNEDPNLKEAMFNMIKQLSNLENTFVGKLDYEYVIDPIALYIEI
ncbi:DUF6414 family protein [Chryseobacterium candidae]|uniref:Uncharacterized protein n=1 Tax=Chryseobacterium candidae TaxID=1978493 RepID=A0ABY2R4B1_9FLAO|nr:hypothetical protein [Chryseobacterium candidae]THV57427.1 hypothetical protein EK417_15475 [Chryseobacterium candidae]